MMTNYFWLLFALVDDKRRGLLNARPEIGDRLCLDLLDDFMCESKFRFTCSQLKELEHALQLPDNICQRRVEQHGQAGKDF